MDTTLTILKFKGWIFAALTALAGILQFVAPARIWNILFMGLGLSLLVSFFWARSLKGGVVFTRERRYTWAQVGDHLEERLVIANNGIFPALWIEIVDRSTLPGYTISRVTEVGGKSVSRWHTHGVCTRRGIFQLGPTRLNMGDPFGLFEVTQTHPNTVDFTITPPILSLPQLKIDTRGQAGEKNLRRYSLSHTQAVSSVRGYQVGDSLNRIHWPTTARRDSFFVRELQPVSSGDWWLALDLDASAHYGENENSTLEKAILVASSLTGAGLSQKHAVGLLAHGQAAVWLPPLASEIQRWEILKTLAQVRPGNLSLEQLLARNRQNVGRNANLVIITASTRFEWLDPLLMLKRQGVSPTAILIFTPESRPFLAAAYETLVSQGIKTYLVDQSAIEIPTPEEAAGKWQWYITGTGKAVAMHKPQGSWEQV